MKVTPYTTKPRTAIGRYVLKFINHNRLTYRQVSKKSGLSIHIIKHLVYSDTVYLSLDTYFKLADFMASYSALPTDHYLRRMKEQIENCNQINARKRRLDENE